MPDITGMNKKQRFNPFPKWFVRGVSLHDASAGKPWNVPVNNVRVIMQFNGAIGPRKRTKGSFPAGAKKTLATNPR